MISPGILKYNTIRKEKSKFVNKSAQYKFLEYLDDNIKESFNLIDFKYHQFDANLILTDKNTKSEIYLGSNKYKYNYKNLQNFEVIINIIGEYPEDIFKNEEITIESKGNIENKLVRESFVYLGNHKIHFLVQANESFNSFSFLSEVIYKYLNQNNKRILIHCEQGKIRSATLLLYFLRKYLFNNINDANSFIGLKRENAGAPSMTFAIIERLVCK